MNAGSRVLAVVHADVLIRMRRLSTLVLFLLLSWLASVWVPAISTGKTLMQHDGHRVFYNSAAIALGTASLASLFIPLAGFYAVSNALRRDLTTRGGFIIASTTVRNAEYIGAKFLGNLAFLSLFTAGYMAIAMVMQVIRGEAPLQPAVFLSHYAVILGPALVMTAALAILFECVPLLSGRFGDIAYFFLFLMMMGGSTASLQTGVSAAKVALLDFSGMALIFGQMRAIYGSDSFGIGTMTFDAGKEPFLFEGLQLGPEVFALRLLASLLPLLLLAVAVFFFRRFDPAKVRVTGASGRWNPMRALNLRLKALAAPLARLAPARSGSLAAASINDALLTFQLYPLAVAAAIGLAIAAAASADVASLRSGLLPIAFLILAAVASDIASRDARAGTMGMLWAAPGVQRRYGVLKFFSTLLTGTILLIGPLVRLAMSDRLVALAAFTGIAFVAGAATLLGLLSRNPKAFLLLFLVFWYVVMNEKGASRLDFAAFFGRPEPGTIALYAGVALAAAVAADAVQRIRSTREG